MAIPRLTWLIRPLIGLCAACVGERNSRLQEQANHKGKEDLLLCDVEVELCLKQLMTRCEGVTVPCASPHDLLITKAEGGVVKGCRKGEKSNGIQFLRRDHLGSIGDPVISISRSIPRVCFFNYIFYN